MPFHLLKDSVRHKESYTSIGSRLEDGCVMTLRGIFNERFGNQWKDDGCVYPKISL